MTVECVLAVDVGGTSIKAEILDATLTSCASGSAVTPRSDGDATLSAVIHDPFIKTPAGISRLFITHVFLTTIGVAGLLIGLAFGVLAWAQDRALKTKNRGALWDWIPSLSVCKTVSYRALAIGFSIYTLGILAGILWSYRTTAELMDLRVKQVGAIIAWILFAIVLQAYINDTYRTRRTAVIGACAFVAIMVAILGIHHV